MDILVSAFVLIVATLGIGALCYSWMKSTRASQRKVETQNERIITLLEEIASSGGQRSSVDPGRAAASGKSTHSERNDQ